MDSSLPRDEIEKKAKLQAENPRYVEDLASGLSVMDKNRIIQRANIIRRQSEAVNRLTTRSGGKKRLTRKGRKAKKGKGTKKARKTKRTKRKTQSKRKGPKKARKTMRRRR